MAEIKRFKTTLELQEFVNENDIEVIEIAKETFNCFGECEISFILIYKEEVQ